MDLSEFINAETFVSLDSDGEAGTHARVPSSQKTADGSKELPTPSQDCQQQHSNTKELANHSQSALNVDVGDLPAWMIKRGQWNYLVSTAGGPSWENLLRIYMEQERRLSFTETVCNHIYVFPFQR